MNKNQSKNISISAAVITMLIGIIVIVGWFTHNDFPGSIVPGWVKMEFNVALGFVFSSIVVLLYHLPVKNKILHLVSVVLSVIVFLIGLLTLLEYVYDFNAGIDELFFKDEPPTTVIYFAGRMSPLSALNFILTGIGLLLLNNEKTATYQFFYLTGIAFVSVLMLIGFNFIADIPTFIRLAVDVATGFITLSAAIWFAQPVLRKKISFERKLFTGFAAVILLIVVLSIFSTYYNNRHVSASRMINHTNNTISEAQQIFSLTKDIESGSRGYMLTGDSNYLDYFKVAQDSIFNHVKKLKELTKNNPIQQVRIDYLSMMIAERIGFALQCIRARNEKGFEAGNALMATPEGRFYTDKIRNITSAVQQDGNNLLIQLQNENEKSVVSFNRAFTVFLTGVFILLLIILAAILNNAAVRKKVEVQSRENEAQIQTIFTAAPDAVIVIDGEGRIVKWNQKSETLFGWAVNEVLGKSLSETIIPHRYREAHQKGMKHFLETGEGPVLGITIEIKAINKNNAEFDVALSISPTTVQGKYLFIGFVRDITQRKISEEKLLKFSQELEEKVLERTEEINRSEKKYRYLFENNPMPMWVIDLNTFKFLDVNEMAILQYGYSRDEFLSMTTLDIRPDKDKELFMQSGHLFEMGRTNYSKGIWNHRKKDGTIIEVETIGHKIIFEGVPARLILSNDVTEKKKAEEKIKGSEKKLRSLIGNSSEVIIISDIHGKRHFVSEAVNRMLGYTPEEFMQLNIFDTVPPEDADSVRIILQKVLDNPHQPFTIIVRIRHKDGSWRWIEAVLGGYFDVPDLNGVVINYRDITERKEAEERMKATLKEISDYKYALDESSIVAITDQEGIIKHANSNFCTISKYSREELIEKDHQIINSGHHPKEFIRDLWVTIANGKIWKGELKNKAKDGTFYWVDTTIIPFLNEENRPYQYVAIKADITERKQAEHALQESRQLLSAIIDNSPAMIYVKDLEGRYLMANRLFSELFHLSQEAIPGKTDYDFFTKEQADGFREMDARTAAADHALTEEEIAPLDDGPHTYLSVKSTLRDAAGKPYAIFGISTDITDRKKAEEAILRAEMNYREIFNKASDAIYVHEIETGKVIEVNHRAYEVTGYTSEELLNTDPLEFITDHPDYTPWHAMNYLQKAGAGEPQLFEWLNKNKNGSHNWLEVNLKKATIAGKERILAFIREINDRKKAQLEIQKLNEGLEQKVILRTAELQKSNELFSKLFNHNPASIAISSIIDGKLIDVNDGFLALNGYSSKEEVLGKTTFELNMPVQPDEGAEIVRLLKENKYVKNLEINVHDKQGDKKWIQLSAIMLEIDNVPCLLSVSIDITERKKAEEQLLLVNTELEAFSYSVSHDLRAPLRAIDGYSKMLLNNYNATFDNEGKRLFGRITENAKKMGMLIDDLLEFSRLGRKDIHKSLIQMTELFEDTAVEMNATVNHKAVVKIHKLHSVNADKKMIKQVMINLLSNAIKYSSKTEKPFIEIMSYCGENEIIYSVTDNGAGFDNQFAHKLFGVFQRLHLQAHFEGTGVGLALVKRIIDKHGGRVWGSGELNKGATFCFSLPAENKIK